MDTDDLTPMAYETLSLAYQACEPMRAEIGVAAADYITEDEFLADVGKFMEEILETPEDYLESWDLLGEVELEAFVDGVRHIQAHLAATLITPRKQRGKPPFES